MPSSAPLPAVAKAPAEPRTAPARRHGRVRFRRATIRPRSRSSSRTRLNKHGSTKETWHIDLDLADAGIDYTVGDSLGIFPNNDPALVDAVIASARRAAGLSDRRPHFARRLDRQLLARRGARHAVPADLLHHRRRAAAKGQGARVRRRSGRRRRHARRARRAGKISRHPARPGSLCRGARSAAAAALFHRVVAANIARQGRADDRRGALRDRQSNARRRRLDIVRRTDRAGHASSKPISRRRTPSACPPIRRSRSS